MCVCQEHFLDVVGGQEFLLLPVEEMERLLKSDDVNVPEEETMVTSLLTWVSHDPQARDTHLPSLLAHIRLPLLQPQVRRCSGPPVFSHCYLKPIFTFLKVNVRKGCSGTGVNVTFIFSS